MVNKTCYIVRWQSSRVQHYWLTMMQYLLKKTGKIYRNSSEVTSALIHLKLASLELDLIQYFMLQVSTYDYEFYYSKLIHSGLIWFYH